LKTGIIKLKLYVFSDIHDNIWALDRALKLVNPENSFLLFLGDFCSPFTLSQLAKGFSGPIHIIWGNNDGDKWLLTQQASTFSHVHIQGEMAELSLGPLRIRASHYPEIARKFAEVDGVDLVCYGHDHLLHDSVLENGIILLNPGEIMGRFGRSTFVEVDVNTLDRTVIEI